MVLFEHEKARLGGVGLGAFAGLDEDIGRKWLTGGDVVGLRLRSSIVAGINRIAIFVARDTVVIDAVAVRVEQFAVLVDITAEKDSPVGVFIFDAVGIDKNAGLGAHGILDFLLE